MSELIIFYLLFRTCCDYFNNLRKLKEIAAECEKDIELRVTMDDIITSIDVRIIKFQVKYCTCNVER